MQDFQDDILFSLLRSDLLEFTDFSFRGNNRTFALAQHFHAINNALKRIAKGECKRLIINIPPRYGKTELAVRHFIAWGLALNPKSKFLHLSYSATLAEENSVAVKDILQSDWFRWLFPEASIKDGFDTKSRWKTISGGEVYATSTLGQITGFGAGTHEDDLFGGAIVIDDPIKPEDAFSDVEREKVNRRFETTIRSRVNSRNTPIVIIMQRLHEHDLCGYLQSVEPNVWEVLKLPAITEDGQALWEQRHTLEELHKLREVSPIVFETQYMQNPKPLEGLLYNPNAWKTYNEIPITARAVRKNYTDTADTGADNLVSVNYIETEHGNYILDMIVTDAPMEETETQVARFLSKDNIEIANIESNNGGRGFARNVERLMRMQGNYTTRIEWFHQTENKAVRIFSNSAAVQNMTYFPNGWEVLFPKAYNELSGYLKAGRNAHDDVEDVLTGMIEKRNTGGMEMIDFEERGTIGVAVLTSDGTAWCRCAFDDKGCIVAGGSLSLPTADDMQDLQDCVCYFSDARTSDARKLVADIPTLRAAKYKDSMVRLIDEYAQSMQMQRLSRENVSREFINDLRETNAQSVYLSGVCVSLAISRRQKLNF